MPHSVGLEYIKCSTEIPSKPAALRPQPTQAN